MRDLRQSPDHTLPTNVMFSQSVSRHPVAWKDVDPPTQFPTPLYCLLEHVRIVCHIMIRLPLNHAFIPHMYIGAVFLFSLPYFLLTLSVPNVVRSKTVEGPHRMSEEPVRPYWPCSFFLCWNRMKVYYRQIEPNTYRKLLPRKILPIIVRVNEEHSQQYFDSRYVWVTTVPVYTSGRVYCSYLKLVLHNPSNDND